MVLISIKPCFFIFTASDSKDKKSGSAHESHAVVLPCRCGICGVWGLTRQCPRPFPLSHRTSAGTVPVGMRNMGNRSMGRRLGFSQVYPWGVLSSAKSQGTHTGHVSWFHK